MSINMKKKLYPILSGLEENIVLIRQSSSPLSILNKISFGLKDIFDLALHNGNSVLADVSNTLYLFIEQAIDKDAALSEIEDILALSMEYFYLSSEDMPQYQHVEEADMIKRTVFGFLSRLDGVEYKNSPTGVSTGNISA
ncbi:hypothetical protein WKV44_10270 [Spirochaetia bacterium 38H-sp]|uniref:Uncharacterized protein n=1 Tax=Rarispira pelagica TaxID=3141764 RepID=A0ABU9UE20_9SPIR